MYGVNLVIARPVYLDNQATTPMDPSVWDAMVPYFCTEFGNPHSKDHSFGWRASDAVSEARAEVADLINADDDEVVFTSGATESCNLALRGVARAADGSRLRVITLATEHAAVLETTRALSQDGFEAIVLPVESDGLLDPETLEKTLDERTLLVSVMAGNNEIGVIQSLSEIAELCHSRGVILHTDATQAAGRIEIDVDRWGVDLLSLSGHKVYGPKGVGALFVRTGTPIRPVFTGGGQELGIRPGTVPTPLVVGLGVACRLAAERWADDAVRMTAMMRRLLDVLEDSCPDLKVFGNLEQRLPGTLNVGFAGIPAKDVVSVVSDRIAISTGSACSSGGTNASRVLRALGVDEETAATGIRISLGRFNTDADIQLAQDVLCATAATACAV